LKNAFLLILNIKFTFKAYLISSRIIQEASSKEILEKKLLPIWSKKQKKIEEYMENVEVKN
jgi:hypothetical protein